MTWNLTRLSDWDPEVSEIAPTSLRVPIRGRLTHFNSTDYAIVAMSVTRPSGGLQGLQEQHLSVSICGLFKVCARQPNGVLILADFADAKFVTHPQTSWRMPTLSVSVTPPGRHPDKRRHGK